MEFIWFFDICCKIRFFFSHWKVRWKVQVLSSASGSTCPTVCSVRSEVEISFYLRFSYSTNKLATSPELLWTTTFFVISQLFHAKFKVCDWLPKDIYSPNTMVLTSEKTMECGLTNGWIPCFLINPDLRMLMWWACLLWGSRTTALPHWTHHHFNSRSESRAAMEARGSLELFLGYCYFPKFLYKSDPAGPLVAAAYSAIHWGHALVSFVLLW